MVTKTVSKSVRGLSSIRTQLILGFGLILALLLITALIAYLSLQSFQAEVDATLNQAARIRELSLEIENEFLLARQSEAEFLNSWRRLGLEQAKSEYLSETQEHLASARLKLAEIETLARGIADEEVQYVLDDVAELEPLMAAYESSLLTTVDLIEQRSQTGGLEQRLQEQLDNLERAVEPLPNPQLQQLVLRIRAAERGYFSSGLQQYVDTLTIRTKDFEELVETSSSTDLTIDGQPLDPSDLMTGAENYVADFQRLVRLEKQIETNTVVFQEITDDINGFTSHIRGEGAAGLARAQSRLDAISRQTTIALIVAAAIAFSFGVFIVVILTRRTVGPLGQLTQAAEQIGQGDYVGQVNVPRQDEFGLLADAFNAMAVRLQGLITSLEEQVVARTQRLEIVATLNEHLAAILNVDRLLQEMVDQIQSSFNYYHAHVYLLNAQQEKLIVAAGTGEAGAEMKAKGHSISLKAPTSLVARAARTNQIVSVDNVREAPDWLANPLLPETYSEMAVPIVLEGQVVGVLDVQQDEVAGLDEGDANLSRSLANQVAVAIRNARLFEEVETALAETREAQQRYVEQAWDRSRVARRGAGRVQFNLAEAIDLPEDTLAQARQQALAHREPVVVALNGGQGQPRPALVAPITLQNAPIGDLQLHGIESDRRWSEGELALIEAVVDQVAQVAESLRLFDEAQERASRERLVGQVSDRLRRAPDMEALMKTAVGELARILGPDRTFVRLGSEAELGIGNDSGLDNGEPPVEPDAASTDPAAAELASENQSGEAEEEFLSRSQTFRSQTSRSQTQFGNERNESNSAEPVDDNGSEPKLTGNGQTIEDPRDLTDL